MPGGPRPSQYMVGTLGMLIHHMEVDRMVSEGRLNYFPLQTGAAIHFHVMRASERKTHLRSNSLRPREATSVAQATGSSFGAGCWIHRRVTVRPASASGWPPGTGRTWTVPRSIGSDARHGSAFFATTRSYRPPVATPEVTSSNRARERHLQLHLVSDRNSTLWA